MDPGTIISICGLPGHLFKAAVALKSLYDAFFDQDRNATSEAREFAQLISTFAIAIVSQGRLIREAGGFLPGEENFKKTIQQCASYMQKYQSLIREQPHAARKAVDIAVWQQDASGERKKLMDKLNLHINFMNSCSMKVLLEIALKDRDTTRSSSSPLVEPATMEDNRKLRASQDRYNNLYIKAVSLQYAQKHNDKYKQDPELVMRDLNRIIEQWRTILIDSGMPEASVPKAPRYSKRDTKDSIIYNWRRGMQREYQMHSRPVSPIPRAGSLTPRSTADGGSELKVSPVPASEAGSCPASERSPVMSRNSSITIPTSVDSIDSGFRGLSISNEPIAEISWHDHAGKFKMTPLYTYDVDHLRKPRSIIWNKGRKDQFEQSLGKSIHPFTKHATFKKSLEVSFTDQQVVTTRYSKAHKTMLTYNFTDEYELNMFQQLVYKRNRLATFDAEKIATKVSKDEATIQHVKLWKSWDAGRHYLTYYANDLEPVGMLRELRVDWFDRLGSNKNSSSSSIKLTLRKRPAPSPHPRRFSGLSLVSGLSLGTKLRTSSVSSQSSDHQQGRRASTATPDETDDYDWPPCPESLLKLSFIEIFFETTKVRNEFVAAFNSAMDNTSAVPTSPTIPEMPPQSDTISDSDIFDTINPFEHERATPSSLLGLPASLLGVRSV